MALSVDITKKLGSFRLKVSFAAESEVLALLGASGSGKSVTLRCIAGIMKPDAGRIVLDGQVLFDSGRGIDLPPRQRGTGYLFQQYALFPNMTVRQNISAVIKDKAARYEKTDSLLKRFQLENVSAQRPAELSGGQQQRAALARILATEPKALLLDEPFSALDSFLKAQLEQELRDTLDSFSGSVVWVSHDRDEVFRNCDKICVVDRGVSQAVITPHELFYRPQTVSAAKLSGCKNILPAVLDGKSVTIPQWGIKMAVDESSAEAAFVGLRAHLFRLAEKGGENAVSCTLVRAMDNVFSVILILRPEGSVPNAPALRVELPKEQWEGRQSKKELCVSIAPRDILLLKQEETKCIKPQ